MKWITRGLGGLLGKLTGAMKVVEVISRGIAVLKGSDKKKAALELLNEVLEDRSGIDVKQLMAAPRVKVALEATVDQLVELENAIAEEVERQRSAGVVIAEPPEEGEQLI